MSSNFIKSSLINSKKSFDSLAFLKTTHNITECDDKVTVLTVTH